MRISLVVAASTNNVIGRDGALPWHLPEDLRRFKKLTTGKPIVMGRATFESIGRPLPERQNIVLTGQPDFTAPGCDIAADTAAAISHAGTAEDLMVIGGAGVYTEFLPDAQRIYMTRIHVTIDGDTFFPELEQNAWQVNTSQEYPAGDERQYGFAFQVLERCR